MAPRNPRIQKIMKSVNAASMDIAHMDALTDESSSNCNKETDLQASVAGENVKEVISTPDFPTRDLEQLCIEETFTPDGALLLNVQEPVQVSTTNSSGPNFEQMVVEEDNVNDAVAFSSDAIQRNFEIASGSELPINNSSTSGGDEVSLNVEEAQSKESSKCKKRQRNPECWKKNKKRCLKNLGREYSTEKGKVVEARKLKRACGESCKQKCSEKISLEDRTLIFENFWKLGDLQRQRDFVSKLTKEVRPKYSTIKETSKRTFNTAYYFEIRSESIRVCKKYFMATLDVGHSFLTTVNKKSTETGTITEDLRGKHNKKGKQVTDAVKDSVRDHIKLYPTKESHYCRASSSKLYLPGDLNLSMMYRQYKEWCEQQELTSATQGMYEYIFRNEFNLSFHTPKKDQCSTCNSYNNATSSEKEALREAYNKHLEEKELCRNEKKEDIEKCREDEEMLVVCFDMQAVLQTPAGNDSLFYYKRRLNVYNCTVYDIVKKKGYCYLWNESLGGKGCDEVGTCILEFLKEFGSGKHILFYTDNCSAQNKNKYLLSIYHYALGTLNVKSITHKYLVVGHTQNEGDSVHSTIETEKKCVLKNGSIFVPSQWSSLIQCAKKNGNPYVVHELNYTDIINTKDLIKQFGKNFTINTDGEKVVWSTIRKFFMQASNPYLVYYKDTYAPDSTLKCFDVRFKVRKQMPQTLNPTRKYTEQPRVSGFKKKDLISLCSSNTIPSLYHEYFRQLPANEAVHDEHSSCEDSDE